MSEPSTPPTIPQPFHPEQPRPASSGCVGKPVMAGCGMILVLFSVICVVLLIKADDLIRWGLGVTEESILGALPDDVTGPERTRLQDAFDRLADLLAGGRLDGAEQQRLQQELFQVSRKIQRGELVRQDVLDLIQTLEELAPVEEPPLGEGDEASRGPGSRHEGLQMAATGRRQL